MHSPTERANSLDEIARRLERAESLTPESLAESLAGALSTPLALPEDTPAFARRGARWELRVLRKMPGEAGALHAHEGAYAWCVLHGTAREIVIGRRDRVVQPGSVVAGEDVVHQIEAEGREPLVILYACAPATAVRDSAPQQVKTRVVIVGGGFSGAAAAIHILLRAEPDLHVTLVEQGEWLGRGIAYGVEDEVFRLNVPAAKMSLDPDAPNDFVAWASAEKTPNAFLPRARYGAYVSDRLARAVRRSRASASVVRASAVRVDENAVVLADGTRLSADVVILATGLAPRLSPSSLPRDPRIVEAWDEGALRSLPTSGDLLVIGAGLTALDVVALLDKRGFSGRLTVLSRRGLLPRAHLAHAAPPAVIHLGTLPRNLRSLLAWGRRVVEEAVERGEPWQSGVDAIRPHVSDLWRALPTNDRARFVRWVRTYWDVLRHRAPIESLATMQALCDAGRLEQIAGEVVRCTPESDGLRVSVRERGRMREMRCDAIVRCIGPALEFSELENPIVRHLVADGRATVDAAGLGVVTDAAGRLESPRTTKQQIFTLGALRRASYWETTSVPEISRHAQHIATLVTGRIAAVQ